ncbi:unnamed protein product [Merluccius merluccius]
MGPGSGGRLLLSEPLVVEQLYYSDDAAILVMLCNSQPPLSLLACVPDHGSGAGLMHPPARARAMGTIHG